MKTALFFIMTLLFIVSFTSCKKTEMLSLNSSQEELIEDKSLGTDSWIISKVQLRGKDIQLQPTTFVFDKNKLVVTSDEIVATSGITILSNDEMIIDGFDITQFKSKLDPVLINLLESMSGNFQYQKTATKILLTGYGVSIILVQGGQKNISTLEQNSWEVIDFKCLPKNVNLEWINGPRMSFSDDMITTSFNNLSCDKQYVDYGQAIQVKANNCSLNDRNVEIMLDLFQGDYTWLILPNGNLEIKNTTRTKIILKPVNSFSTTAHTNILIQ